MALTNFNVEEIYETVYSFLIQSQRDNPYYDTTRPEVAVRSPKIIEFLDENPKFNNKNSEWDLQMEMYDQLNAGIKKYAIDNNKAIILAYRFGHLCFCFGPAIKELTTGDKFTKQFELNTHTYNKFVVSILTVKIPSSTANVKIYSKELSSTTDNCANKFAVLSEEVEELSSPKKSITPPKTSWIDDDESDGEDIPKVAKSDEIQIPEGFTPVKSKKVAKTTFKDALKIPSLPEEKVIAPTISSSNNIVSTISSSNNIAPAIAIPSMSDVDFKISSINMDDGIEISGTFKFKFPDGQDFVLGGGVLKNYRLVFVKK